MVKLRRILRYVVVTLLLAAAVLPVSIYLLLATPWAQDQLRQVAQRELTVLLGSPVEIGRVDYEPFNTIAITSVSISDPRHQPALTVGRLMARFELIHFVRTGRLNFDYVLLDAPEVHLSRANPKAPLNIQPIIDRLKPKDKNKPPTEFDLTISTVSLRNGRMTYDVLSAPRLKGRFDPSHISLRDIDLHAYLRQASRQFYNIDLEALSFSEHSGLTLSNFTTSIIVTPDSMKLSNILVELPSSHLKLKPIEVRTPTMWRIDRAIDSSAVAVATDGPARISTDDLAALIPHLGTIHRVVNIDFDISASRHSASVRYFDASDSNGLAANLSGQISGFTGPDSLQADVRIERIAVPQTELADILSNFTPQAYDIASRIGSVTANGSLKGNLRNFNAQLQASTPNGTVDVDGALRSPDKFRTIAFQGSVEGSNIRLDNILHNQVLGPASFKASASGQVAGRNISGRLEASVASLTFKGHTYRDIDIEASHDGEMSTVLVSSPDPSADFNLRASGNILEPVKSVDLDLDLASFCPEKLNIPAPRPGLRASGKLAVSLTGSSADDVEGFLLVNNLKINDNSSDSLMVRNFTVTAERSASPQRITIESDILRATVEGTINPSSLPAVFTEMARGIMPAMITTKTAVTEDSPVNDFTVDIALTNALQLSQFLHLPVQLLHPVDIKGTVQSQRGLATLTVNAPYLQKGDKIIDSTVIEARMDGATDRAYLFASTHMPTKKGPMSLTMGINAANNSFDTKIDWNIDRKIPLNGKISFLTKLSRQDDNDLCINTKLYPGQITFGDDVWQISPSDLQWCAGRLDIDGFALQSGDQRVAIDGVASASPDDIATIELTKINLVSIFENLEIENALLVGQATGTFTASQALSKVPVLTTDRLHVDNIGYNYCVLGDGDLSAHWDNESQSFYLDADIVNPQGQHSRVYGNIFPTRESLDLHFDAKHIRVGFMQAFMKAFASDISGYASGHARLYGTFSNIDMEGDILAEDLRLRINFTNTYYTATDSIHIRPGLIELPDITLHDTSGHTARLSGTLTHTCFRSPSFDFRVTDARNFLSYNVTAPTTEQPWYGTIYGNGGVSIVGKPGEIAIGVDMATAAGSTFTFILSDRLQAEQYSFITFNDATKYSEDELSEQFTVDIPEAVRRVLERPAQSSQDQPSNYIMDLSVDITPQARINLIMDPVGGDNIRANGTGDLRLYYNAFENDLKMFGKYTLDSGNYNFTLQDIIIKDFAINPGSTITFRGDPYSAQLDLEAVYQLNANLSDLDESFSQDKDLNRTNVPVQALLKVSGDMRQPDLAFDLRFPTLTSDTYRKVRSIISTDEMMNRQIIYLLALNRFYTPDYMASTGKGSSELFSVASSTLSSQLSSILGKLSDNWSIAPNLRSDRGDFSDVEVDVALSSRLLNNRLLFNGNFGYRDKALNNNQFIGDFDIEYLLNPKGSWRLRAYNRYNDQNYYVRTAATTQGVGVVFRRDFDSLFRRKGAQPRTAHPDTTAAPTDTTDFIEFK